VNPRHRLSSFSSNFLTEVCRNLLINFPAQVVLVAGVDAVDFSIKRNAM